MKKISQMVLGLLLVVLSLTVTPKAAFAENKTVTVIEVENGEEFKNAIKTVNSASEGEYVISLTDDMDIGGASIQSQCPVTLLGNGHTLTIAQYASIHVAKGAQVRLGSDNNVLKICGVRNEQSNDEPGLLYIQGTCDMYSGVSLSEREGNNYFGGGVTVEGGTFHMLGGEIKNCGIRGGSVCYGGGVAVYYGGKFIMDGGEIKDCYADSDASIYFNHPLGFTGVGGGVFVSGGSSFVMNGGTISNNKATSMGGGIAVMASIEEIVDGGWGNLQSMVEIKKGGTVKNNSAQTGAGVFASASYYCPVYAICAPTPAIGQSANPGLYIDNAQILDNVAPISSKDKDVKYHNKKDHPAYGMGGGLFVAGLKSPAGVHVGNNTVIRGNKAAVGGGFAAKQNTYDGQLTITNTVLCNNIAERAASDVYLDHAPLKLPSAEKMNALYLGEPDDVYDQIIDGWYIDGEDLRYTARTKEQRTTYAGAGDAVIGGTGEVCLIAAAKPSLAKITFTDEDGNVINTKGYLHGTLAHQIQAPKAEKASDDTYDYIFEAWSPEIQHVTGHATYKATFKRVFRKFNAKYQFNSVSDDERLPDEVKALLPADTTDYRHEQNITAIAPSKTVVEVKGGQWVFKGFEKETIPATMEHADETGNVTFVAHWEFVRTTPKFEDDINLPQTGDNSDIALWSALLAVSAAVLIGMAFRGHQKKTR